MERKTVVRTGELSGILSRQDIFHTVHADVINKTEKDVMNTSCMTIPENAPIDEAIGMIVSLGIKRLPVLDLQGNFKGLISRESLLRTGYGDESQI
jgi:CBS domain-containing protein